MSILKEFGNWVVNISDDDIGGISYKPGDYFINYQELLDALPDSDDAHILYFEWLIHLLEKTWLSNSERINLNDAFLFCLEKLIEDSKKTGISEISGFQIDNLIDTYNFTLNKQSREWEMRQRFRTR